MNSDTETNMRMNIESSYDNKLYYSYNDIHNLVYHLAEQIKISDFRPDYILAIGGGGFIPARIMRSFIDIPIISITVNFYDKENNITTHPNVIQWIDNTNIDLRSKKILIVDEIDDTRKTLKYIISRLMQQNILNFGIAVIHNKIKPKELEFDNIPYFCAEEIPDKWVVYPWDTPSLITEL